MNPIPSWLRMGSSRARDGNAKTDDVRELILKNAGIGPASLVLCKQVHSIAVKRVRNLSQRLFLETDGLLTSEAGLTLGIFTADCVPAFLWDNSTQTIGLLHAGWRGASGGILTAAVRTMKQEWGNSPSGLSLHLGPHIRECCYEVMSDCASHFSDEALRKQNGKTYLSLARSLRMEAVSSGMSSENVTEDPLCTFCGDNFFSFRRNQTPQRMLSYIVKSDAPENTQKNRPD